MTNLPRGNRVLIRSINRSAILNAVKNNRPIGRADIARQTGLSPATVTSITGELIAEELIFEKTPGDSSGGRPPILLDLNPRGGYVVGIKLMENQASGALTDLEASVLVRRSAVLLDNSPQGVVDTVASLVDSLLSEGHIPHGRLLGVGVGLAGIIDSERSVLRQSPYFGWVDVPLREMLQKQVKAQVSIDNDVNTLTLAEMWFGHAKDEQNFLILTIGRGVGLGIVFNNQLYRGAGGGAGEFGHTIIDPNGPLCACGKHGCLEAYVSDPGLLRTAQRAHEKGDLPDSETIEEFIRLAEEGHSTAQSILSQAGEILGQSIANLINLTNPGCILISGEGVRNGPWMFDAMQVAIRKHTQPPLLEDVEICIEPWGDEMWARGAASLVLRELFEPPVHSSSLSMAANS